MTITQSETALCNAGSPAGPSERGIAPAEPGTLHPAMTERDRRPFDSRAWLAKFGAYCTPPALLTERRPAVDTMRRYVERGRYTEQLSSPLRRLAKAWLLLAAVPAVAVARLFEWLLERPGRFAVAVVTVKLLSTLPPVAWLVDHVIHPGSDVLLAVFL